MTASRTSRPLALLALALLLVCPATAQDTPPDTSEINTHYSLYWEDFKNQNYEDALPELRWILTHAPDYPKNNDRNYRRGVTAYDSLAARTADAAGRRAHLNAALALFEEAVSVLPPRGATIDVFKWIVDKGRFIQTHPGDLGDLLDEAVAAYRAAYALDPMRLDPYYIGVILHDALSKEDYAAALRLLNDLDERRGDQPDIQPLFERYYPPIPLEHQAAFWEAQREARPGDVKILRRLLTVYQHLGDRAKIADTIEDILPLDPSADLLIRVGTMALDDGDYARARGFFRRAQEQAGFEPSAAFAYSMGFAEHQQGNLQRARVHYREALALDAAFGKAYLALGDLYAAAVSVCAGSLLERTDRAVYWLSVDWWEKARTAAPSDTQVVREATAKISTYRQYFPDSDEIFFAQWTVGQAFPINYGCYSWIGETTTVRPA